MFSSKHDDAEETGEEGLPHPQEDRMKKIQILFVCLVMAGLVAGAARTILAPKEINTYENRYASQLPAFSRSAWQDGTFQDGVDEALMDQVPLAQTMKSLYNRTTSRFLKSSLDRLYGWGTFQGFQSVEFNGLRLTQDGAIIYWPQGLYLRQEALDEKITALNRTFANHPELEFFVYYIEKDTDVNFTTGEKMGLGDYLLDGLTLDADHGAIFSVDDYATFAWDFYKTDAHWNHQGSYEGYCQLLDLLGVRESPLVPTGEATRISTSFSGKKAASVAGEGVITEDFYGYPFDFPSLSVTINGEAAQDYGDQDAYLAGTAGEAVSYGGYYGGDNGETVFSSGTQGRGNLLVIGDSFDNAVLKLLATHYDNLYSIDLRYYEHSMGQPFDLTSYTQKNGISQVLLIGNLDYYTQDTFDPEV
jgi:hypothetical protein